MTEPHHLPPLPPPPPSYPTDLGKYQARFPTKLGYSTVRLPYAAFSPEGPGQAVLDPQYIKHIGIRYRGQGRGQGGGGGREKEDLVCRFPSYWQQVGRRAGGRLVKIRPDRPAHSPATAFLPACLFTSLAFPPLSGMSSGALLATASQQPELHGEVLLLLPCLLRTRPRGRCCSSWRWTGSRPSRVSTVIWLPVYDNGGPGPGAGEGEGAWGTCLEWVAGWIAGDGPDIDLWFRWLDTDWAHPQSLTCPASGAERPVAQGQAGGLLGRGK